MLIFTKGTDEDKYQEEHCTPNTWVYDLRTNMLRFGKCNPFSKKHLAEFETAYEETTRKDQGDEGRWREFSRDWIAERGDSLDISWLKDDDVTDAADLLEPSVLATEAMAELKNLMLFLGADDEVLAQEQLVEEELGLDEPVIEESAAESNA